MIVYPDRVPLGFIQIFLRKISKYTVGVWLVHGRCRDRVPRPCTVLELREDAIENRPRKENYTVGV